MADSAQKLEEKVTKLNELLVEEEQIIDRLQAQNNTLTEKLKESDEKFTKVKREYQKLKEQLKSHNMKVKEGGVYYMNTEPKSNIEKESEQLSTLLDFIDNRTVTVPIYENESDQDVVLFGSEDPERPNQVDTDDKTKIKDLPSEYYSNYIPGKLTLYFSIY